MKHTARGCGSASGWIGRRPALDTEPGALNVQRPRRCAIGWSQILPPGWKPDDFVGRTIDLGVPAARDATRREVERMVTSYKLDMLEHDGYLVAQRSRKTITRMRPRPAR